jgi:hypothetical protein
MELCWLKLSGEIRPNKQSMTSASQLARDACAALEAKSKLDTKQSNEKEEALPPAVQLDCILIRL